MENFYHVKVHLRKCKLESFVKESFFERKKQEKKAEKAGNILKESSLKAK